jgi:hypothetical protein
MINELIVGILVIFANVTLRTSGLEKKWKGRRRYTQCHQVEHPDQILQFAFSWDQ